MHIFSAINTLLLFVMMGLMLWRFRLMDLAEVWDEIEALKLRMTVQEKTSPCAHCRNRHGLAEEGPGEDCCTDGAGS